MKTIKILMICLFVFTVSTKLSAQSADIPAEIISALDDGNAARINAQLSANVELVAC